MPGLTDSERIERLENVVQHIAEDQISLQGIVADLATQTRKAFDQVAEKMNRTDEQMRRTDERIDKLVAQSRETDQRMRQTDERIGSLVVAIGEFMRQSRN